jgi:hypothetical protein
MTEQVFPSHNAISKATRLVKNCAVKFPNGFPKQTDSKR